MFTKYYIGMKVLNITNGQKVYIHSCNLNFKTRILHLPIRMMEWKLGSVLSLESSHISHRTHLKVDWTTECSHCIVMRYNWKGSGQLQSRNCLTSDVITWSLVCPLICVFPTLNIVFVIGVTRLISMLAYIFLRLPWYIL